MTAADVRSPLSANLNEVGNKSLFGAFFELKCLKFEKFGKNKTKSSIETNSRAFLKSLSVKPITLFLKILTSFRKTNENLVKNYGKCE